MHNGYYSDTSTVEGFNHLRQGQVTSIELIVLETMNITINKQYALDRQGHIQGVHLSDILKSFLGGALLILACQAVNPLIFKSVTQSPNLRDSGVVEPFTP